LKKEIISGAPAATETIGECIMKEMGPGNKMEEPFSKLRVNPERLKCRMGHGQNLERIKRFVPGNWMLATKHVNLSIFQAPSSIARRPFPINQSSSGHISAGL
jgi:hypothetical protein